MHRTREFWELATQPKKKAVCEKPKPSGLKTHLWADCGACLGKCHCNVLQYFWETILLQGDKICEKLPPFYLRFV